MCGVRSYAAAVVLVVASVSVGQANTIAINQGTTTIGSLTDHGASVTIAGFVGVNTLSSATASAFSLWNSSPEIEAGEVNFLTGGATNFSNGTQISPSGTTLVVSSPYFGLKLGDDWVFFENTSLTTLNLTYTPVPGQGSGLSHMTIFGTLAPVPGPLVGAGLPGLVFAAGGLLVLGWMRRQRGSAA